MRRSDHLVQRAWDGIVAVLYAILIVLLLKDSVPHLLSWLS